MKPTMVNGNIPATNVSGLVRCKGCNKMIKWGKIESGAKMCFETDTNHTAHWANCPAAEMFRGGKQSEART